MQEGFVNELVKIFISIVLICMLATLAIYFIGLSNLKEYKQYVSIEIERNGGLTHQALEDLEALNQKYYGGKFSVSATAKDDGSATTTKAQPYGTQIDYQVKGKFELKLFFELNQTIVMEGSAVSMIRTEE